MKNITRILTIVLACLAGPAAVSAQSADDSFKAFRKLRDDKEAKPTPAYYQKLCASGVDFLAEYSSDTKKARTVVNDLLSYGTTAFGKDKAQRAAWFAAVQYAIVEKQSGANEKAQAAFAGLNAAIAEGETMDNPSGINVNEWRAKIDKITTVPGGAPFALDREKGFYNFAIKYMRNGQQIADTQLEELAKSKDKETANWAKQEMKIMELRKTPFTLAFTTLDGKVFDSTTLKNNPALYVYVMSTTSKTAAKDLESLMDNYYEFSRKQVEFVVVLCDPEDNRADVQAFVKKQKIKCPVFFDGQGVKGDLCQKLAINSVPGAFTAYLFDGKGNFLARDVKPGDLKKYIK